MPRKCQSIHAAARLAAIAGVCLVATTAFAQSAGKPKQAPKAAPKAAVAQPAAQPANKNAVVARPTVSDPAQAGRVEGPIPRGASGACLLPGGAGCIQVATAQECTDQGGTYEGAGSSCPVVDCPVQSFNHCQDYQYPRVGGTSLASMGPPNSTPFEVADDFKTDGAFTHDLTQLCWWGVYSARSGTAISCAAPEGSLPQNDRFVVTIYRMTGGLPDRTQVVAIGDQPLAGQTPIPGGIPMTVTKRHVCANNLPFNEYHATLSQPISLAGGTCYAMEIRNPNDDTTNWFWGHTSILADNVSWQDTSGDGYTVTESGTGGAGDRAWCMNIGLDIFMDGGACSLPPPPICANPDANGQVRGAINGGGFSNDGPTAVGLQLGDSVQFAASGNITNVCFWGFWLAPDGVTQPPGPDVPDFDFTMYDSDGSNGLPNTVLFTGHAGTTPGFATHRNAQNYNVSFPPFAVTAHHCYYLSISFPQNNADPAHAFRFVWGLAQPNAISNEEMVARPGTGGNWDFFNFGTDPAFPANGSWVFDIAAELPSCGLPPPPPPPPANDNCASATAISGVGSFSYDNRGATTDGTSSCDGTSGLDVWFDWTPSCDGSYSISMCALSTHDSVLTIFDGNACLPSTELACDDDGCGVGGGPSVIQSVPVLNAHHYLIRVAEFGGGPGEQGGFTISRIGGDCPNACPCDWNHDNALNSQDFFDFLNSFFAGNADFNHDNITNSQDFFDFLNCFFAGCH